MGWDADLFRYLEADRQRVVWILAHRVNARIGPS